MNKLSFTIVIFVIYFFFLTFEAKSQIPVSGSTNLLRNSSFTRCANSGIPDWWGTGAAEHIERWKGCYGTANDSPVTGTRSLKITNPLENFSFHVQSYAYPLPSGKEYTFSVYLKGDSEGLPVRLSIGYDIGKEVTVTKEWQRYWVTGAPQRGHWAGGRLVVGFSLSKRGTIWVAAPQLEYGNEATPYQPADTDKVTVPGPAITPVPVIPTPALPIPEAKCIKAMVPPIIDGKLDEDCWKEAEKLSGFVDILTGKPASADTECYIVKDAENLYIAFRCFEPDVSQIKGEVTRRDGSVFADDSVEIFIDPEPTDSEYWHFAANVLGTQYDAKGFDASWDAGWKVATARGDGEWTAELAIPFYCLGLTPRSREVWRLNLCRNRPRGEEREWSAWSCTYGSFHRPARFGRLYKISLEEMKPYFYQMEKVLIKSLEVGTLSLSAQIVCPAAKLKKVTIEAEVHSPSGETETRSAQVTLKSTQTPIKIAGFKMKSEPGEYKLRMTVREPETNRVVHQVFERLAFEVPGKLVPLRAVVELSYYTREPKARVMVQSNLKEPIKIDLEVLDIASGASRKLRPLDSVKVSPKGFRLISYNISCLPAGKYEATVSARNEKGETIAQVKDRLIKLPPAATEVKVNRISRTLLVNGKPFIVYAQGIHGFRVDWWLDDIKSHGFNTVVASFPAYRREEDLEANESGIRHFLDECQRRGLKVVFWIHPGGGEYEALKEGVLKTIERFKGHPAILCWYLVDEPEGWWEQQEGGKKEEDLIDLYKAAKEVDPYRPAHINWYSWRKGKGGYGSLEATDIGSLDRYPIDKVENAMKSVADIASLMNEDCRERFQPTAFWIQMYGYDDAVREPTPKEEKCMTYICLIYGMRLVYYFIYKPMSVNLWESMKELGKEIEALEGILTDEKARELAVGVQGETIHYCLWERSGKYYLIACNGSDKSVQGSFEMKKLIGRQPKRVRVWFENRGLGLKGERLVDFFGPFERHVYELTTCPPRQAGLIDLAIS